ncbi:hypothetical protein ABAC460_12270 [Asticcacaulis sp. AC460]|uniref:hypothetical protein n=1 Tax=Asticcacaulis sp. AC460 TaxID=1282360 RepID=UPI0003C3B88D|nr:hypothetical protein [Asticcacaulis sp. AC460]ESQ89638.1 hypothetical protein ABAC460_12270 [Asticcacaulis sp. AC460]
MAEVETLRDGDRISHKIKGLGTVTTHPETEDKIVPDKEVAKAHAGTVYVTWDDDRFPVAAVPRGELEKVPEAAAAISTGF